jgi:phosphate/sulfate permease
MKQERLPSADSKTAIGCMLMMGLLIGALAVGLWVACLIQDKGANWIVSVLLGASVSVYVSWFLCFLILRVYMHIIRGKEKSAMRELDDPGFTDGERYRP